MDNNTNRIIKSAFSPIALLGWFTLLLKPIMKILEWFQNMEFIGLHLKNIDAFFNSGLGTLIYVVIGVGIIGFSIYHGLKHQPSNNNSSSNFDEITPLKQIWKRDYSNQEVPLDGIEYIECKFSNVTFRYEGLRPTRLTNCDFAQGSQIGFGSSNPAITQTMLAFDAFQKVQLPGKKPELKVIQKN